MSSRDADRNIVLTRRVLRALTVFLVFGQRLAIPSAGGSVSFSMIVVLIVAAVLYRNGILVEDRDRTGLYLIAISLCLGAALARFIVGGPDTSLNSLLLLVVLYAPFCLVFQEDVRTLYGDMVRTFCGCALVIAVLAIAQILGQLSGVWTYTDLFASVVPHQLVVGGYNTAYPISFGSALVKANGVFCLEPSFCSQILALAIVCQLVLDERRWRLLVFLPAIVATVSGTGVLLLVAGVALQMVRRGPAWSVRVLSVAGLAVVLAALTPYGRAALARTTEVHYTDTSGNQRLVAPYTRLWDDLAANTGSLVIGRGPGFADREANQILLRTGLPAQEPPVTKLITEYGLVAGTVGLIAIATFLSLRAPSSTIAVAVLVFYFVLSASLLEGQTIYLSWLFTSVFGGPYRRTVPASWRAAPASPGVPESHAVRAAALSSSSQTA